MEVELGKQRGGRGVRKGELREEGTHAERGTYPSGQDGGV